jgi:pyruvate-ferredoxin/flavodoxin oxidoreductase
MICSKASSRCGTFVLNTLWDDKELEEHLPNIMKKQLADKEVKFYTINAIKIAEKIGLGNRIT